MHWKISIQLAISMDLLLVHNFVILCIRSFEITSSLSYADLPNVDTFHYILKNLFLNTTILIRKILKHQEAVKVMIADKSFLKILFLFESLNFLSLITNTVSCFPWGNRLTMFILKKSTQVWIATVGLPPVLSRQSMKAVARGLGGWVS